MTQAIPLSPTTLRRRAEGLRDAGKGRDVSFSPKVFIPLTRLCRDVCGYCVYRQTPRQAQSPFLEVEQVLQTARRGAEAGCREALFVLGERPEERYAEARSWLRRRGFRSSIDYLAFVCAQTLQETALYPHSNPGTLSRSEMKTLQPVNASLGLMMEILSPRLHQKGGPHQAAPSKDPALRLKNLEEAGRLGIPFTTGLLIGIGENASERKRTLEAIARLHDRFGHVQEVIVQNFQPKKGTSMAQAPPPSQQEMLETIATARIILGPEMNIQAPPNLAQGKDYLNYLDWGINDWGGISPLTIDYVNPEAPWPHLEKLRADMRERGFRLKARFPVYPEYILKKVGFLPAHLARRLLSEADGEGGLDWPQEARPCRRAAEATAS